MDELKKIRAYWLREWFRGKPVPADEKSYVSQLMNEKIAFGEKAARRLEDKFNMPIGYLDMPTDTPKDEIPLFRESGLIAQYMQAGAIAANLNFTRIAKLSVRGSMGPGSDLSYSGEDVVEFLPVSRNWIQSRLGTRPEDLRVITGAGDSMAPTFSDGDLLIVDTSKRQVDVDGVYAMSAHGRLFIKRVRQKITGEFEISSDNPTVKTVDVLNGQSEVTVHGRVVWTWNGAKL